MISFLSNLRVIGCILIAIAFLIGASTVWLWVQSTTNWRQHQDTAYVAGMTLYGALQNGAKQIEGLSIEVLQHADQKRASDGQFRQISGGLPSSRITIVPIAADALNRTTSADLTFVILSPDITYSVADLPAGDKQLAAEITGTVTRKLASFCSDPTLFAKMGDQPWVEIHGLSIWGCNAAPPDRRLLAVFISVVGLGFLITLALNLSTDFTVFAQQLRSRRRIGGPSRYDTQGPRELKDIVSAVNSYLEVEREQLSSRAAVLSGVSHDLGTPAARLRLRAALISDPELREKFEADIDSMTGIIESVLFYTNAEMDAEAPRRLSLTSLVDAIVADFQDVGRPVKLRETSNVVVQGGQSIFMSRQGQGAVPANRDIIVYGRPIALNRAITNLIENAIKYGRRANIALEATASTATVIVEDEGKDTSARDIEALLEPFQRGENTATIDGHGLGLTIVSTIAKLHGGTLSFEDKATGVAARLEIQRG